ncbi:MAG: bifunctional diaminohydroxyphosphoribosylaminopyrimidine deaminase/5-amino-6-(5-phosphoribosylamino)uracil reductase RibD [Candidatus Eremiobacteraeota bacterium]|nr:bifunctional diaminohydroxyphosphoribosylaminopyrimidine deaminase/5-amino-6-(5-phosphoribosylamino)uracil reductase RibD [Candidatus Eremiobacteraeota bacterium]
MENTRRRLTPLDQLYLQRAYELAARGIGNTWPNPPVGALLVRDGRLVGEGYHHRAGESHAEANALRNAGAEARGATLYISLEPCGHVGRTPPCSQALIDAGVARVVAGTLDPTEHGAAMQLRRSGIDVIVADDPTARDLIEIFTRTSATDRPYVALKMAMTLDGVVARRPGIRERLGSEGEDRYVRDLRIGYDAVMVGAETVRIDDPQLTVRPLHDRLRPYVRVVACESDAVSSQRRVFAPSDGYATTIVLAPAGLRERFDGLRDVADLLFVGEPDAVTLELGQAMKALRGRGLFSILCEGGPKLAGSMIAAHQVDRVYWAIAPRFLRSEEAVPVLAGDLDVRLNFDRVERAGDDVILSATLPSQCHPEPVEG